MVSNDYTENSSKEESEDVVPPLPHAPAHLVFLGSSDSDDAESPPTPNGKVQKKLQQQRQRYLFRSAVTNKRGFAGDSKTGLDIRSKRCREPINDGKKKRAVEHSEELLVKVRKKSVSKEKEVAITPSTSKVKKKSVSKEKEVALVNPSTSKVKKKKASEQAASKANEQIANSSKGKQITERKPHAEAQEETAHKTNSEEEQGYEKEDVQAEIKVKEIIPDSLAKRKRRDGVWVSGEMYKQLSEARDAALTKMKLNIVKSFIDHQLRITDMIKAHLINTRPAEHSAPVSRKHTQVSDEKWRTSTSKHQRNSLSKIQETASP